MPDDPVTASIDDECLSNHIATLYGIANNLNDMIWSYEIEKEKLL